MADAIGQGAGDEAARPPVVDVRFTFVELAAILNAASLGIAVLAEADERFLDRLKAAAVNARLELGDDGWDRLATQLAVAIRAIMPPEATAVIGKLSTVEAQTAATRRPHVLPS